VNNLNYDAPHNAPFYFLQLLPFSGPNILFSILFSNNVMQIVIALINRQLPRDWVTGLFLSVHLCKQRAVCTQRPSCP